MDKKKMLSERLKHWRKRRKLTQEALAEKANTTQKSISSYENARIFISYENAREISAVLGINPMYLLCETDNPNLQRENLPENVFKMDENIRRIPLYSSAGAGGGKTTEEDILEMIDSDIGDFGVKVIGDSMSPVVADGGTVVVEKIGSFEELERGQMVVVRVNGDEAMVKYLTYDEQNKVVVLRSENFEYPPKVVPVHCFKNNECEILGIVVEIRNRNIPKG